MGYSKNPRFRFPKMGIPDTSIAFDVTLRGNYEIGKPHARFCCAGCVRPQLESKMIVWGQDEGMVDAFLMKL